MKRIETDGLIGPDPSVSGSSVFPFFVDACQAWHRGRDAD